MTAASIGSDSKISRCFKVGRAPVRPVTMGCGGPLVVISGPCVIESAEHLMRMAESIKTQAASLGLPLIFKSSYDKANRTSLGNYRGVGIEDGLAALGQVRERLRIPVVTDVHSVSEVAPVAAIVDMIQIPAFLCRQTDLLVEAGKSGLPVMIKKGQFLAPEDMRYAMEKVLSGGQGGVALCERGSCFGYRELIVDYRSLLIMREMGAVTVFDATHSVQVMGGGGGKSAGRSAFVPALLRAAVAVGVDGVFLECHDNPSLAPSDGPNMLALSELSGLLSDLKVLDELSLKTR